MRALGPGSVSSFLKIILDVVYVALCISILLIGLGMVASLLFDLQPCSARRSATAWAATA
jgi:hypothetical protein